MLDTKVKDLDRRMEKGFEQVDKRFEQVDHHFHALHRTLITAAVGVPAAYAVLSRLIS